MEDASNRNWLTKEEAEAFVGANNPYYLEKWKAHSGSTLKGWNWAAALFGIQWMTYRKMYVEALLYYLFLLFAGMIIGLAFWAFRIRFNGDWIQPLFGILAGVFGNALYRKKALRTLRKFLSMDDHKRLTALQTEGGTSIAGVIVGIVIQFAIAFLLLFLL